MLFLLKALPAAKSVLMLLVAAGGIGVLGVGCHMLTSGAVAKAENKRLAAAVKVQRESAISVSATNVRLVNEHASEVAALRVELAAVPDAPPPADGGECPELGPYCRKGCLVPQEYRDAAERS